MGILNFLSSLLLQLLATRNFAIVLTAVTLFHDWVKIIWRIMEFGKKADVTVNLAFADIRVKRNVLIFEER